jgi:hypothetical protein
VAGSTEEKKGYTEAEMETDILILETENRKQKTENRKLENRKQKIRKLLNDLIGLIKLE